MKRKMLFVLLVAPSVFASDQEIIENLDFFKNLDLIQKLDDLTAEVETDAEADQRPAPKPTVSPKVAPPQKKDTNHA